MGELIGAIRLPDDSGSEIAVSEILKEADYTVFVFYRGEW